MKQSTNCNAWCARPATVFTWKGEAEKIGGRVTVLRQPNSKPTVISSSPHQADAIDGCLTDWWSACTFHQARENKVEVSSRPCFRWEIVIYFGPERRFTQLKYAFLSWNTQDPKVYIRFWGNFIRWKLCSLGICKTQLFQSIPAIVDIQYFVSSLDVSPMGEYM